MVLWATESVMPIMLHIALDAASGFELASLAKALVVEITELFPDGFLE
jgi:hypothetical protein